MRNKSKNQKTRADVLLLEHPRPIDPEKIEYVVNAPLSACLMTGYIASFLENEEIDVDIVDANLLNWSIKKCVNKLEGSTYKVIGIRLVYLWTKTGEIYEMISELRKRGIKAHINLYGHYSTFAYKKILEQYPFIDSVTIGEPEQTFYELAKHLISDNENGDLQVEIDGLATRKINKAFVPRKLNENLNGLPFPERNSLKMEREKGIVTYILGSRGCYNNCGFCYLNPFYGKKSTWRGRNEANIFGEIYELYKRHGCKDFYFADANFFGKGKPGKKRAQNLANLIIENSLKINFGFECRANDIDEDTISMLVKAGLDNVFIGIESGNEASLKSINKNLKVQANKDAIKTIKKFGIKLNMGFIMFDRNANLTGIRKNFEFLNELELLTEPYTTAHLLYHRQSLFEGTPDYQEMLQSAESANPSEQTYMFADQDNYELLYNFKNENVSVMSDITTNFCAKALSAISLNSDSNSGNECECSNSEPITDSFLLKLNELLIRFFNETLVSIESGKLGIDEKDVGELKKVQIIEIEKLCCT